MKNRDRNTEKKNLAGERRQEVLKRGSEEQKLAWERKHSRESVSVRGEKRISKS